MIRAAVLASVAAALLTGPALAQDPREPSPERGREMVERWCVDCHLIGPDGPGGDAGPSFQAVAETRSEEALRAWISDPHPPMPKLDISANAVDDIAAYISSLAP
jgi:cytochrome c